MTKRVLTGITLILVVGLVLWAWRPVVEIALTLAMLVGFHEMFSAFRARGAKPVAWPGYLFCLLTGLAASFGDRLENPAVSGADAALSALVICLLMAIVAIVLRGKVDFESLSVSVFPLLYPGLFFAVLLNLPALGGRLVGTLAVVLAVFIASMNDCFALFAGMAFGKHKLSPEISPKKTVEGSIGGLIAAVGFAVLLPFAALRIARGSLWEEALPALWTFLPLGLVAGALSQIGDLAASLVKRHCGIKDFGRIFPGHGGVLDRLDGILFAAVPCYLFFSMMGY